MKHNHDVAPERARTYPRNRRLTQPQLAIVEDMLQSNEQNHTVKEYVQSKVPIIPSSSLSLDTFKMPCTMTDIRNIRSRLKAAHTVQPLPPPQVTESDDDDGNEGVLEMVEIEDEEHEHPHHHLPAGIDEEALSQLPPELENLQDVLLASPDRGTFESRLKCIHRLTELWQQGKDILVVAAPHHRNPPVWDQRPTNPHAQLPSHPDESERSGMKGDVEQVEAICFAPTHPFRLD